MHIAGVVIFPGDEESGRQASGFFSGSDIMKDIINSRQINIQRYLDELTTILKYVFLTIPRDITHVIVGTKT